MQSLSTTRSHAITRRPRTSPDHAVWVPAAAFIATASALAIGQLPLAGAMGLAASASAGSVLLALARSARHAHAQPGLDRLLQGVLCAALLWIAQLVAAGVMPPGAGLLPVASAVLALFVALSALEAAASGALCLFARRGLPGCIAAAILIDNRAFSSLGALKR
ncbi:MAG: hypothetical protein NXH91_04855 [Phyllobacteriaceae bacterium]|jgi:hypothetical protein|nr:hypothetical protein [Phyllobacteriaceae bacterium]